MWVEGNEDGEGPPIEAALPETLRVHTLQRLQTTLGKMASEGRIDVDVAQMAVQAGQVIAQLLDVVIQQAATVEDVGLGGRSKSINVLFHAEASQLTRGLYKAPQLAMALLAGDVTTEEAMIHCRDVLHRSNINSDVIRYHHHKMRESSDSDFGEVAALAWVQATTDKKQLVSYAAAARVTGGGAVTNVLMREEASHVSEMPGCEWGTVGTTPCAMGASVATTRCLRGEGLRPCGRKGCEEEEQQWVRQGNDWCVERALEWLRRGGAQQAQLKTRKVETALLRDSRPALSGRPCRVNYEEEV
ncbi:hypothetical protein CYMTET_51964 [Cymbomonas tetramitiformis]|uniref:Uncharacterized protein n=1 Tax=Cymbomonas tetramitiformis TaxID=36881 RepID=A0AAE0BLM4_9CHLO|nr:hypothetical protein CYMTET_51964 [Cymbomonas tetramitiformis]